MMRLFILFLACFPTLAADFFPASVWYGGGKARAPMLERDARAKKELWRGDIRQIKALGFNTVRTWIDWATGEPREGQYNFENLDVMLELAQEEGLKVFLQVYMDSAPFWVGRKHPDSFFVSSNGAVVKPESCRATASIMPAFARPIWLSTPRWRSASAGTRPSWAGTSGANRTLSIGRIRRTSRTRNCASAATRWRGFAAGSK